jgi:hypothetical protein
MMKSCSTSRRVGKLARRRAYGKRKTNCESQGLEVCRLDSNSAHRTHNCGVWVCLGQYPGLLRRRQELLANNASLKRDNDALARKSQELLNQQINAHTTKSGDSVPVRLGDLSGTWKNLDEGTRGLTMLGIRVVDKAVFVHAWGKCQPTDCDWGEVPAVPYARDVSSTPSEATLALAATFKTNFKESVLTIRPENGSLRVEQSHASQIIAGAIATQRLTFFVAQALGEI